MDLFGFFLEQLREIVSFFTAHLTVGHLCAAAHWLKNTVDKQPDRPATECVLF